MLVCYFATELILWIFLQLVLRFIVILLVACIANYWIIIPAAILVTFFVIMRWYYLKTSREIKRLEAIG